MIPQDKKESVKIDIVDAINDQDILTGSETIALLSDIRSLIEVARRHVSTTINTEMVLLYWHIGDRIHQNILNMERAEKSAEHVELLRLEESGIRVAEYLTELPPRRLLESKLHEAVRMARERIAVCAAGGGIE
jgi:hypothetical protein